MFAVRLARAHLLLIATMMWHNLDHFRQGVGRTTVELRVAGTLVFLVALVALPFTFRRHPRAPLVAVVLGFGVAIAVATSHLAPHWSALSYSYPSLPVDGLSWAAMLSEIAGGIVLGMTGLARIRHVRTGA